MNYYWTLRFIAFLNRHIVEEEQQGQERAKYGAFLINELFHRLTASLGNSLA